MAAKSRSMMQCIRGVPLAFALVVVGACAPEETKDVAPTTQPTSELAVDEAALAAAEQEIIEKFEKHKSMTANWLVEVRRVTTDVVLETFGEGIVEYARRDRKQFLHMTKTLELTTSILGRGPGDMKRYSGDCYADGEFAWVIFEEPEGKVYTKKRFDTEGLEKFGRPLIKDLHKTSDVALLPDERHKGKAVFVIEARPKVLAKDAAVHSLRYSFRKSDGVLVKITGHDYKGQQFRVETFTHIRLDVDIPADHFTFEIPPGARIVDETQPAEVPATRRAAEPSPGAATRPTTQPGTDPGGVRDGRAPDDPARSLFSEVFPSVADALVALK